MKSEQGTDEQAVFHDRIGAHNLAALWVGRRGVDLTKPKSPAVAARWHYDGLRDDLAEAGRIVTAEEAFRRVLVLENPAYHGEMRVTNTLYAGLQLVLPDIPATIFEGEAEIALVIGKRASNVKAADAMDYVFGYTNFIDGSARGLLPPGNTFYQMKGRETFAPIGPYLVTKDEIADPQKLQVTLTNNGTVMQNFNTDDMAHKIPRCVEFVSSIHTLEPGDILATGTNHRGLNPFMDGDVVELEVEGLGKLSINIQDDLKRTWARVTRLQHAESGKEGVQTPQLTGKYAPS
jgi:hypothetical protein